MWSSYDENRRFGNNEMRLSEEMGVVRIEGKNLIFDLEIT